MSTYKVLTDMVANKSIGDTISSDELEGCSIEALINSGHLAPTTQPKKEKE